MAGSMVLGWPCRESIIRDCGPRGSSRDRGAGCGGGGGGGRGGAVVERPVGAAGLELGRTAHTKCGTYLLASSLDAALLNGFFEHPADIQAVLPCVLSQQRVV